MPYLQEYSSFQAPLTQWNGHLQTIIPSMKRTFLGSYERERIILKDGDFLDLDWIQGGNDKLLIITHGLEGNADRHYVKAPAQLMSSQGFDILAWNCRSCSGEMNRMPKLYHHGDYYDIEEVISHAMKTGNYTTYDLLGFSMGGNISVKFAAKSKITERNKLRSVISVSAPSHLKTCVNKLEKFPGTFYGKRFYKKLKEKMLLKEAQFPGLFDKRVLDSYKGWKVFDDHISAPLNGYKDAEEFYYESSSKNFLPEISDVPVYIINAENDPILSEESHPLEIAQKKENIFLNLQKKGGHTGFVMKNDIHTYAERQIEAWLQGKIYSWSK